MVTWASHLSAMHLWKCYQHWPTYAEQMRFHSAQEPPLHVTVIVVGILVQTITTMRQRERQLEDLRRKRRGVDDKEET